MTRWTNRLRILVVICGIIVMQDIVKGVPVPLGKSQIQATHAANTYRHVRDQETGSGNGFSLSALLRKYLPVIPNTYYDIPKHRYPYYDENGSGRLLYGYGGKTLYKYTVFKPLEGYFKR